MRLLTLLLLSLLVSSCIKRSQQQIAKYYYKTGELKYIVSKTDKNRLGIVKTYNKEGHMKKKIDLDAMLKHMSIDKVRKIDPSQFQLRDELDGTFTGKKQATDLIIFFDYHCKFCQKFFKEINVLKDKKTINIIYKELPMLGKDSTQLSWIALAVNMIAPHQYHQFQYRLISMKDPSLIDAFTIAKTLGIDQEKLTHIIKTKSKILTKKIADNWTLARKLKINGTPTTIIGPKLINGAVDLEVIRKEIAHAHK